MQSSVDAINIDGYFTANNSMKQDMCLQYCTLRSAYKMFFGADAIRDPPPPCLDLVDTGPLITTVFQF